MRENEDTTGRPVEGRLTTENLAHPGTGHGSGVYPGGVDTTAGTEGDVIRDDPREDPRGFGRDGLAADSLDGVRDDPREVSADEPTAFGRDALRDEPARTEVRTDEVGAGESDEPLLGGADADGLRKQWSEIQGRFVDDPQEAVRSADTLVAEVMQELARTFSAHKQDLEGQWDRGEQVATEDLRLALQRYRSFFNRLLNT
ncbi:hypothetical protein ACFXEL_32565 [Streptomyces sp. NPDC059382]|uniref:hypothetical protein n=1 Tax=Streptomyces sp. NPDC059382 TaxID=3346816 RepID=UPI00368AA2EE